MKQAYTAFSLAFFRAYGLVLPEPFKHNEIVWFNLRKEYEYE